MITRIDLNSDLGEGFGPWKMGDDSAMLTVVTSTNIACGAHAGDPETMYKTLIAAHANNVVIGAHPGFADREGFGRRVIAMTTTEIERMVAAQIGALMGVAALAGTKVNYVKPHGALSNIAMDDRAVADAIVRAIKAVSPDLALLAVSGTCLEAAGVAREIKVFSEIFADRTYLATGQLAPRSREGAVIHDKTAAAARLVAFMATSLMPTLDGPPVRLDAHSICVHGDNEGAVAMAHYIRSELTRVGIMIAPFMDPF